MNLPYQTTHGYFVALSLLLALGLLGIASCQSDTELIDMEPPRIDLEVEGAFPQQCAVLLLGESFTIRTRFTDNVALGSFSIDIHHNFDQHNHSTEVLPCTPGPKREAINPYVFIKSFEIPEDSREYITEIQLQVPKDVDPGDYHFTIQVTDEVGWSTRKGLSIKISE